MNFDLRTAPSSRRQFLKVAAAGAVGALWSGPGHAATLPQVKLAAGLDVPLLGMGTGVKAGNRSNALQRSGEKNFIDTVRLAYDEGVRLFDCADSYGSLPMVSKALKDKPRESFVLVTKIWCHPKGGIPADEPRDDSLAVVERSLREADSEYIDLVQLHCQTAADWTTTYRPHMDALDQAKQKGWIRAHGCSCHSLDALKAAAADPWVDVVHARINPWGVKMDGPADVVVPVLRQIHEAGKGIIGMKLIGEGDFREDKAKIDETIRFVLGLGCVDALIVGFEKQAEIIDYKQRLTTAIDARAAK
jgi:aryl-alcohol dehydrogenase-like predicted oxidoreductase